MLLSSRTHDNLSWSLALFVVVLASGCSMLFSSAAVAGQRHPHPQAGHADTGELVKLGDMQVPDVVLVDQDGNDVRFYSELIAGKMVVINFVFTTCTTICPPMGANFARLQRELGELAGNEVYLISVSVDPVVDTPPRLKAWRDQFKPAPGWTMVTGPKAQVDEVLKALRVFTPDKLDHSPTLLLGNDNTGDWTRAHGLTPPATLAELVREMLAGSGRDSESGE